MARALTRHLPSWKNALLALLAAGLLILAFPDFELWWTAWFALVPLMWAVGRQKHCVTACFLLGWLFGTAFFFGTCWWLTYAPIHYAGMPWPLAYFLISIVCLISGLFPAIFTTMLSILLRRFGNRVFFAAPFVWGFTEFARYWITGNNWNAIGYSQAFSSFVVLANVGGVHLVGFLVVLSSGVISFAIARKKIFPVALIALPIILLLVFAAFLFRFPDVHDIERPDLATVIAVQPNVPMSGLTFDTWHGLTLKHTHLAEGALENPTSLSPFVGKRRPDAVIFPESPMNFAYNDDLEFQRFIGKFARENNVSVLFNSSEPDKSNGRYFNSAVVVGPDGGKVAEYDKIYLLPFGEAVPSPLESIVPAFVGHFSYGSKYDLIPIGDAKAGVMICFESHFGELSRRYVQNGADVIIEMTNDGYLGPTPVLRQHLANAVFRAVETNRPVLRVTNVGITAYIDERGIVVDELPPYTEGTRAWSVLKSDGSQTFYVKYGDWFAWLCTIVTVAVLGLAFRKQGKPPKRRHRHELNARSDTRD